MAQVNFSTTAPGWHDTVKIGLDKALQAMNGGAGGGGGIIPPPATSTVIEFDGVDDRITFAGVDPGDDTFSVAMWIRPTALTESWQTLLTAGTASGFYCRSSGLLAFNTVASHFSATPLVINTWYHVCFTNNAGSWVMYINGVSDATGTGATTAGSLNSMGDNSGGETFHGRIAQAAVFDIAISAQDVADLYAKTKTPATVGNCLAYWPLDDVADGVSGDGVTFLDVVNGNDGVGSDGANNSGLIGRTSDF